MFKRAVQTAEMVSFKGLKQEKKKKKETESHKSALDNFLTLQPSEKEEDVTCTG